MSKKGRPVKVVLKGRKEGGKIIVKANRPPCERNHTEVVVEYKDGQRESLVLIHDENFEYV